MRRRIECVGEAEGDGGVLGERGGCGLVGDMAGAVVGRESGRRTKGKRRDGACKQCSWPRLPATGYSNPCLAIPKVVCSITYTTSSVLAATCPRSLSYLSLHLKKLAGAKARGCYNFLREDCCRLHTSTSEDNVIMPSPLDNTRRHVQVFAERVGAVSISTWPTKRILAHFPLQTGRWLRVPWTLSRRRPLLEPSEV